MNPEMPGQIPETEHTTKPEVWLVDDDDDVSKPLKEAWEEDFPDFSYKRFVTARKALEEIDKIIESDVGRMPEIIFVDGHLERDREEELRLGENLIKAILERLERSEKKQIRPPLLVAHSNSSSANEKMVAVGGEQTVRIDKGRGIETYEKFFKYFLEQRSQTENSEPSTL